MDLPKYLKICRNEILVSLAKHSSIEWKMKHQTDLELQLFLPKILRIPI